MFGGFIGHQNVCVPQQHSTILVSGFSGYSKAQADKARAPWVTWQASDERSLEALVKLLDQNGKLKGKTIAALLHLGAVVGPVRISRRVVAGVHERN